MHALIYDAPQWADGDQADKQAVLNWVNAQDLPGGHVLNLLYTDGHLTAEYLWVDWFGCTHLDVVTCDVTPPPAEFYTCSRRIAAECPVSGGNQSVDVLLDMGGAWVALSWQMLLESGRRARAWWQS